MLRPIEAPCGRRGIKARGSSARATVADNAAWSALAADWAAYLGRKPSASRIVSSFDRVGARDARIARRYNRGMDAEHVLSCGSDA